MLFFLFLDDFILVDFGCTSNKALQDNRMSKTYPKFVIECPLPRARDIVRIYAIVNEDRFFCSVTKGGLPRG